MGAIVGIDLGTSSSKIAYMQNGRTFPVKNKMFGCEITPSIVGINEHTKELKVGKLAESFASGVICDIKRRMGDKTKVKLGGREYTPEEITAMILKYLKEYGEDFLNDEIKEAVITIPPGFTMEAKQATEAAADMAGLRVLRIIQEPVAALLAFGFDKNSSGKKKLVYDLGGGTFNASVVVLDKDKIKLAATAGLKYSGGNNFDQKLVFLIKEHLLIDYGLIDIDAALGHKIKMAAKKAKEKLTESSTADINIPFIGILNNKVNNFEFELPREKFNELIEDQVNETITCMDSLFKSGAVNKSEISKVLLTGGSTRIPMVKEKVSDYFGFPPSSEIDAEMAVSYGAAVQAGMLKGVTDSIIWI